MPTNTCATGITWRRTRPRQQQPPAAPSTWWSQTAAGPRTPRTAPRQARPRTASSSFLAAARPATWHGGCPARGVAVPERPCACWCGACCLLTCCAQPNSVHPQNEIVAVAGPPLQDFAQIRLVHVWSACLLLLHSQPWTLLQTLLGALHADCRAQIRQKEHAFSEVVPCIPACR